LDYPLLYDSNILMGIIKLFALSLSNIFLQSAYIILLRCLEGMKANRILLAMIAAVAIFATPSVLTSPILAQTDTGTQGTTDEEGGNQATTGGGGADESPEALYQEFETCLTTAEGTEGFASEDDIITCFTDAGYTQGIDDDNEDEDDEEENEDNDEETNN
jgi:hypothetical protein